MTVDEVMRLVTFMRNSGVASFRFGELAVEYGPQATGPIFSDQANLFRELVKTEGEIHDLQPDDMGEDEGYSDDDLFGSSG